MRKLLFISALAAVSLFSLRIAAEHPGRYVRKQLKPSFFIPAKDIDYTEKLPEFNYYPNKPKPEPEPAVEETQKIQVLEVINEIDMSDRKPQVELPIPAEKVLTDQTKIESKYLEYNKNELSEIPEYKQKYDDYISDLKTIAKTGAAPENPRVAADLAKMDSNERLAVDDSFGLIGKKPAETGGQTPGANPSEEIIY